MAYTPTEWKIGDTITAELMNKIEQEIKAAEEKKPTWGDISNKPTTFPAAAPKWEEVTEKPTTFPPAIGTTATTALAGNTTIPTVPATMAAAEATAGTATTARTISAKVLNDLIDAKIAAAKEPPAEG